MDGDVGRGVEAVAIRIVVVVVTRGESTAEGGL